jgi:hypothetical protein
VRIIFIAVETGIYTKETVQHMNRSMQGLAVVALGHSNKVSDRTVTLGCQFLGQSFKDLAVGRHSLFDPVPELRVYGIDRFFLDYPDRIVPDKKIPHKKTPNLLLADIETIAGNQYFMNSFQFHGEYLHSNEKFRMILYSLMIDPLISE